MKKSTPKLESSHIAPDKDHTSNATKRGILQSKSKENDWGIDEAYQNNSLSSTIKTPDGHDLSREWWDVETQDGQYSCVGWAVADLLRWHFVETGSLAETEKLSAKYLWMAAKETDDIIDRPTTFLGSEGSTIKAALDVARKYGVVTDSFFSPNGEIFSGRATEFYARASLLKISSYINLFDKIKNGNRFNIWKEWLCNNGPIIIRIEIDEVWHQAMGNRESRFDNDNYNSTAERYGHAALLSGYTEKEDFILRNTWGSVWGNKGHALISREYISKVVDEAYGIYTPTAKKIRDTVGYPVNELSRPPGT